MDFDMDTNVDNLVILELLKVIEDYNIALEIKRLEKLINFLYIKRINFLM